MSIETITIEGVVITLTGTWHEDKFDIDSATASGCILALLDSTTTERKFHREVGKLENQRLEAFQDSWEYTSGNY